MQACCTVLANQSSDLAGGGLSENHTPVRVHVPMAQEYEAVTTLLWVFGTSTKPLNKQDVIQSLDS